MMVITSRPAIPALAITAARGSPYCESVIAFLAPPRLSLADPAPAPRPRQSPADRLRALRKGRGWTQNELADRIGSTQITIARWETEARDIGAGSLAKLASVFDVPESFIAYGGPGGPSMVEVIAQVRPGGFVERLELIDHIDAPFTLNPSWRAVRVVESGGWPVFNDGDILLCRYEPQDPTHLIGVRCLIWDDQGRCLIGRPRAGRVPGKWLLERDGSPPLDNVTITTCAKIEWTFHR